MKISHPFSFSHTTMPLSLLFHPHTCGQCSGLCLTLSLACCCVPFLIFSRSPMSASYAALVRCVRVENSNAHSNTSFHPSNTHTRAWAWACSWHTDSSHRQTTTKFHSTFLMTTHNRSNSKIMSQRRKTSEKTWIAQTNLTVVMVLIWNGNVVCGNAVRKRWSQTAATM